MDGEGECDMDGRAKRLLYRYALGVCSVALLSAQSEIVGVGSNVTMISTDLAVLEAQEVRKDIPCTVTPNKPVLGFDLRYHISYDVTVPMKDLAGAENILTILFRITSDKRRDEPFYFSQHVNVPYIEEDTKGDAFLTGNIDLGEGNYHVDWLMRDRSERVCSFYWDSEVALPSKDKAIELTIPPNIVESTSIEQFTEEPPVERVKKTDALNVKVLVNFGPQNPLAASMRPIDTSALVTILRHISREPQFGKFSLVAFNMQEQRVLYRQGDADKIDFPALGRAVQKVKLGTVDSKTLAVKHADTEFLADLLKSELGGSRPDAVIFAGPKVMLDEQIPDDQLKPLAADVDYPVFYFNYNLTPQATPWRDSIGKVVKTMKGTEFTITRPRDLWFSATDMVSRIVKSKHERKAP